MIEILGVILAFIIYTLIKKKFFLKKQGVCFVCEKVLYKNVESVDDMTFCSKHFHEYEESSWVMAIKRTCDAEKPEEGFFIYELKGKLLKSNISSYIKTDYFDHDGQIKTNIMLYCRDKDLHLVQNLL